MIERKSQTSGKNKVLGSKRLKLRVHNRQKGKIEGGNLSLVERCLQFCDKKL